MSNDDARDSVREVISQRMQHELAGLQKNWWCFLLLGILLILSGTIAVAYPWFGTATVVTVLGALLLVSGVATVISSFWTGQWSAFLLQVLVGVLYVVIGLAVVEEPLRTAGLLTLFIGAFAIVVGVIRSIAAMTIRFPQWGWALLNGVVTALFGILIFRIFEKDPRNVLFVLGFLIGFELMLNGWTWVMLALELKALPGDESENDAAETTA